MAPPSTAVLATWSRSFKVTKYLSVCLSEMSITATPPAAFQPLSLRNPQFNYSYHVRLFYPSPISKLSNFPNFGLPGRRNGTTLVGCPRASISRQGQGMFDPELRSVLQLATDSELYELERILFGPSHFSPFLKSITKSSDIDYAMVEEDPDARDDFLGILESRFLFLAADARSTLRGWRPTYRNVLLGVRKKLSIPCSTKLSTEDLEVEIFLHLLQDYSSEESGAFPSAWRSSKTSNSQVSLEVGLNQWKVQSGSALRLGAAELRSMILKGGGMLTLGKLYELLGRRLSGRMFLEAANYQMKIEVIKKGGHFASINLESRAALLAAKQGLAGAASRYLGIRSMMVLLGPMLWGTFLADVVIQMLGTDYARILRAIYAFAQIRITQTFKLPAKMNGRETYETGE